MPFIYVKGLYANDTHVKCITMFVKIIIHTSKMSMSGGLNRVWVFSIFSQISQNLQRLKGSFENSSLINKA